MERHQQHRAARYDRVLIHASSAASVCCVSFQRLPGVLDGITDHVAISATLESCEIASWPGSVPDPIANQVAAAPRLAVAEATASSSASANVVCVGNRVNRALATFRALCRHIARDPEADAIAVARDVDEGSGLPPWESIPCAFRCSQSRQGNVRWWASRLEQLEPCRVYAQYMQWVERCGLEEVQLSAVLRGIPVKQHDRGSLGIPPILRERQCVKRRHALLALRATAYERAAVVAGTQLGDQEGAALAWARELMSCDAVAMEAKRQAVPVRWLECVGLRVVPRCFGDYLVGLFEL